MTTLFGVPIPLPTPQGRRAQQLKTRPECWIRGLHEASTQGIEATSANLFSKEYLGMQRSPKAMLLRPTIIDFPECDCHLPTMESVGRRSRPVPAISDGVSGLNPKSLKLNPKLQVILLLPLPAVPQLFNTLLLVENGGRMHEQKKLLLLEYPLHHESATFQNFCHNRQDMLHCHISTKLHH